ncbi:hypothetical protein Tco_1037177, partial [Tanacetum coccineum]
VGDHIEAYQTFADMLKKLDREDLEKLWKLVKEMFNTTIPTNDKEKELWVELNRLFKPDKNDMLWKLGLDVASDQEYSAKGSYETYIELDIDSDVQDDIDAYIMTVDALAAGEADVGVKVGIKREDKDKEEAESSGRGTTKIGVDRFSKPVVTDGVHELYSEDGSRELVQVGLDIVVQELYDHMVEIPVLRITYIESVQASQGYEIFVAYEQRAVMSDRIRVLERDNIRLRGMLCVKRERIDSLRCYMAYT